MVSIAMAEDEDIASVWGRPGQDVAIAPMVTWRDPKLSLPLCHCAEVEKLACKAGTLIVLLGVCFLSLPWSPGL